MRKLIKLPVLSLLLFVSCQNNPKKEQDETKMDTIKEKNLGSQKDANGCVSTAGFVFSVLKKKCVQPWEEGSKFVTYNSDHESAVYVILADNKLEAELIGLSEKSIVLKKVEAIEGDVNPVLYENKLEKIEIKYYKDQYYIFNNGEAKYGDVKSEKNNFADIIIEN